MKSLSLAAAAAALSFLLMPTGATAQMHGGHMAGSVHSGGGHFAGRPHGLQHPGFVHDGRFAHFHGRRFDGFSSFVVIGAPLYPWYAYSAPVYANTWYYYCPSAAAYYPTVTYCPEGWVLTAAPEPLP